MKKYRICGLSLSRTYKKQYIIFGSNVIIFMNYIIRRCNIVQIEKNNDHSGKIGIAKLANFRIEEGSLERKLEKFGQHAIFQCN